MRRFLRAYWDLIRTSYRRSRCQHARVIGGECLDCGLSGDEAQHW